MHQTGVYKQGVSLSLGETCFVDQRIEKGRLSGQPGITLVRPVPSQLTWSARRFDGVSYSEISPWDMTSTLSLSMTVLIRCAICSVSVAPPPTSPPPTSDGAHRQYGDAPEA